MAHCITALVARPPVDEQKARQFDLPLLTEGAYVILPLDYRHADIWEKRLGLFSQTERPIALDRDIVHFFARELAMADYVLIDTDYFGGVGEQRAVLYKNGQALFASQAPDAINQVLRRWGVKAENGKDEFDTLGLGKYRFFSDLFDQYES